MSRPALIAPAPHRFTREEYHRMGEAGLFARERVELLDGTIVTMCPQNSPHAATTYQLHRLLTRVLGDTVCVRAQLPIILDDWSEPEPDVAVCAADPYNYAREHPTPEYVLLACEVATSSLTYDRSAKASAYAASGIPEYWIIDVESRIVHVLADPDRAASRYGRQAVMRDGDVLPVLGGAAIAVADVLPRI